jgi:hypothetical protein
MTAAGLGREDPASARTFRERLEMMMSEILTSKTDIVMGARVYEGDDQRHVGTVVGMDIDAALVRWHKGYATWVSFSRLRPA